MPSAGSTTPSTQPTHLLYLVAYLLLFTVHGLLITSTKVNGSYDYSPVTVILVVEVAKLVLTAVIHVRNCGMSFGEAWRQVRAYSSHGKMYVVPAACYGLYNYMFFAVLRTVDPAQQKVLMNVRVLITGILSETVLGKRLGWRKWLALLVLLLGCVVTQLEGLRRLNESLTPLYTIGLVSFQALLSSFASVYNQLLVTKDLSVDINIQNIYMYTCSLVLATVTAMLVGGDPLAGDTGGRGAEIKGVSFENFTALVWAIVFVLATVGIVTSRVIKYLGVFARIFANAIGMFLTAYLAHAFFETPVAAELVAGMVIVTLATFAYNWDVIQKLLRGSAQVAQAAARKKGDDLADDLERGTSVVVHNSNLNGSSGGTKT